ncbi:integrase catalytic domain-containing protein [Trichonephila clavipes]|nr:integrase catalytic domain-containing protein [Trichonephila clavipes]
MNGTKFAHTSPTEFSYSARKRESNGTSFHPLLPISVDCGEANIKSMKRILLRVAKSAIMNFEELTTLMAQIEAVLNSRPLSPLSSDPNDLNPLTPGHFLTNCAISSFPEPYTASDSLSYHSSSLKDPNTKTLDWPMGRILEVFPGSDGLVRVVNVKTSTGILKRAITKVVPLPIPVDPATVEKEQLNTFYNF